MSQTAIGLEVSSRETETPGTVVEELSMGSVVSVTSLGEEVILDRLVNHNGIDWRRGSPLWTSMVNQPSMLIIVIGLPIFMEAVQASV